MTLADVRKFSFPGLFLCFILISAPLFPQNHADARKLAQEAVALYTGVGSTRVDVWEADTLFLRAAKFGDVKARMWVAIRAKSKWRGDGVWRRPIDSDAEARSVLAEIRRLADAGDAESRFLLAKAYLEIFAAEQLKPDAVKLFQQACPAFPLACTDLAVLHYRGEIIQKNPKREFELYEQSCARGVERSCQNLAIVLFDGEEGVPSDKTRALKTLVANCDREVGESCFDAGMIFATGDGVSKSRDRALEHFTRGCVSGNKPSCVRMKAEMGDVDAQAKLVLDNEPQLVTLTTLDQYFWLRLIIMGGEKSVYSPEVRTEKEEDYVPPERYSVSQLRTNFEAKLSSTEINEVEKKVREWRPLRLSWDAHALSWERAKQRDTEASYKKYLTAFPEGENKPIAESKMRLLDRVDSCSIDSVFTRYSHASKKDALGPHIQSIQVADLVKGNGDIVTNGDEVEVHATFRLLDGTQLFPRYYDKDFSVRLGDGLERTEIQGLARALAGMKVGGKRKVTLPGKLAWGENGEGCNVPRNAAVVIEVELLQLVPTQVIAKKHVVAGEWLPLVKGQAWRYSVRTESSEGNESNEQQSFIGPAEKIAGRTMTQVSEYNIITYYGSDETGVYVGARKVEGMLTRKIYEPPRYLLKSPFNAGTTWQSIAESTLMSGVEVPLTYRIEADNDKVTVPLGEFNSCLRVSATGMHGSPMVRIEMTSWYARGIGLVKETRKEVLAGKTITIVKERVEPRGYR